MQGEPQLGPLQLPETAAPATISEALDAVAMRRAQFEIDCGGSVHPLDSAEKLNARFAQLYGREAQY
ncbi:MAG TPA: hypothetical protein VLE73_05615 [Candidatus Saccharimonadales bacterium]|nr:hypothetical protein [Candidatus Saccharimonadales bacterium]